MDRGNSQSGLSYLETLLAVTILGVALVPALEMLQIAYTGSAVSQSVLTWHDLAAARMEDVLSVDFSSLEDAALAAGAATTPSSYSDTAGMPDRVLVFLSPYDGDNADADGDPFTGTDAGILWVRVAIENSPVELSTLVAQ